MIALSVVALLALQAPAPPPGSADAGTAAAAGTARAAGTGDDENDDDTADEHPDPLGVRTAGDVDGAAPPRLTPSDLPPPDIGGGGGVGDMIAPLLKTMLMLGVVLAVVYLLLGKGLGKLVEKTQSGKRMRVVERVALDPRRSLVLVELDGKQMLIGSGEGGVTLLKDLGAAGDAAAAKRTFDEVLVDKKPGSTA